MEEIYNLIQQRNSTETLPFVSIHSNNSDLKNVADTLQRRCESLDRQCWEQQQLILEQAHLIRLDNTNDNSGSSKNERLLREKISKLQDDLNDKLRIEATSAAEVLLISKELSTLKETCTVQTSNISKLKAEIDCCNDIVDQLTSKLEESKSRTRLAENQFLGLKDAIRSFQDENEELTKLNKRLLNDTISEKEKYTEEFNGMNEMVEKLNKEVSMLRSLSKMNKSWFGLPRGPANKGSSLDAIPLEPDDTKSPTRLWGTVGAIVLPSQPQFTIHAHKNDALCVRYDGTNQNLVATASSDGTVRVWNTSNGQLQATFHGSGSDPMLGVDISGGIVCGCGADRTCRVWKYDTNRMIHQLAGHSQKVTCIRLFPGEKNILTASADRSIKVWDITRNTYTQTTTFRHSSTANCSDVSIETQSVATGHLDGGLRLWDTRTGDRAVDITNLHSGGLTSVHWNPRKTHEILTNGRDSSLKIVDSRTKLTVSTFHEDGFRTLTNYASSSFSPDGMKVGSCSGENGDLFIWDIVKNQLEKRLSAHQCSAVGFAWGRGGTNGQQIASIDKSGVLILWA